MLGGKKGEAGRAGDARERALSEGSYFLAENLAELTKDFAALDGPDVQLK